MCKLKTKCFFVESSTLAGTAGGVTFIASENINLSAGEKASTGDGELLSSVPLSLQESVRIELRSQEVDQDSHVETYLHKIDAFTETCAISLETFLELMLHRGNAGKGLIIAQVFTRDPQNPLKSMTSFYHATPLLRVIFKRERDNVKHRYSESHPLVARNPLTNSPITGEVRFYLVGHQSEEALSRALFSQNNEEKNNNNTSRKDTIDVPAMFIGTDYNFANSRAVRSKFIENCLEDELQLVESLGIPFCLRY
jgi:hypothetical protein